MPSILAKPAPHDEAAAFIATKPVLAREAFDRLLPDLKARAFTITGVESANVMQAVRDRIAELPQGADWDAAKKDIVGKISPWLDASEAESQAASERRAELLLRTHGYQSYAAAAEEVGDRQRAAFPFCQYLSSDDDAVRDSHQALNGLVLPADDPFWETHTPPWEWGCRCQKVWLTRGDVADIERDDARKPPEARRVVSGARLQALRDNRLIVAKGNGVPQVHNVSPSKTYTFNPKTVKMDAGQLQERYEPVVWQTFEGWARDQQLGDGRNVLEWLGGGTSTPAPVTAPPAAAPAVEKSKTQSAEPVSPRVERKAIQEADYKKEENLGGGVNTTIKLTNGRTVVFKPGAGEDPRPLRRGIVPGSQYKREVAASVLDEQLGLGLVPPTALLTRAGSEGSAQLFKAGFREAGAMSPRAMYSAIAKLPERVKHDWQLFDDLVGHLDRHAKNFLLRVQGDTAELALIDNGLAMSSVAQGKRFPGIMEGGAIDATNLARLRDLVAREAAVTAALQPYLEASAIEHIFTRARALIERKTYGDVPTEQPKPPGR